MSARTSICMQLIFSRETGAKAGGCSLESCGEPDLLALGSRIRTNGGPQGPRALWILALKQRGEKKGRKGSPASRSHPPPVTICTRRPGAESSHWRENQPKQNGRVGPKTALEPLLAACVDCRSYCTRHQSHTANKKHISLRYSELALACLV